MTLDDSLAELQQAAGDFLQVLHFRGYSFGTVASRTEYVLLGDLVGTMSSLEKQVFIVVSWL